jgi:hypothetical protein
MATACWAFIVAKRTGLETAPLLDFRSLHLANIDFHPQLIHMKDVDRLGIFSVPPCTGPRRRK